MSTTLTQTDNAADCGAMAACSGGTLGVATPTNEMDENGTAGTTEVTPEISSQTTEIAWFNQTNGGVGIDSWSSGTYTININVTTGDTDISLEGIYICRIDSSCNNLATVGSDTSMSQTMSAGTYSHDISGSSQSTSLTDDLYVIYEFSNINEHMSSSIGITPDQDIVAPFNTTWNVSPSVASVGSSAPEILSSDGGEFFANTNPYHDAINAEEIGGGEVAWERRVITTADWPQWGYEAKNHFYVPELEGPTSTPSEVWTSTNDPPGDVQSSPVVLDGDIIWCDTGLTSHNMADGSVNWNLTDSSWSEGGGVIAYNNGTGQLYMARAVDWGADHNIYEIDPEDGSIIRTFDFTDFRIPAINIWDSKIICRLAKGGNDPNKIAALDFRGNNLWTTSLGESGENTNPVYDGVDTIYAQGGDNGGRITALDINDGTEHWDTGTSSDIMVQLAYGNNRLYEAAGFDGVRARDPANGGLLWSEDYADEVNSNLGYIPSEDVVYAVSDDGVLAEIDASTGNSNWTHSPVSLDYNGDGVLIITGNLIYWSVGGKMVCTDRSGPSSVWSVSQNTHPPPTPISGYLNVSRNNSEKSTWY